MTDQDRASRWLARLPSTTALFVLALGAIVVCITVAKGVTDPDFFWHYTAGKYIAGHGVPSTDPFSFTWAGKPWTPHEWLSELVIYWLVSTIGRTWALVVYALIGTATFAVLATVLARRGVGVGPIGLACGLAAFVFTGYVTLRPQAESWLLLAGLLGILLSLRADRPVWTLILVPYFVLWANLHGLYVVGLGVVAVYILFTLAGRTPMATERRWMVAAGLGCLIASMATPAGPIGVLYPLRYLQPGNWGLANIQEWQSPNFHDVAQWGLLALILALAFNAGRATPGWMVFLSWVGVVMALVALRNGPIAAVFAVPPLAFGIGDQLRARRSGRPARQLRPSVALGRRLMETGLAAVVAIAATVIFLPGSPFTPLHLDQDPYPRQGVDLLERVKPTAHVLAEYGWGGYVIYRMYESGGRVFVDGRNDMYSEQILNDYSTIRNADDDWPGLIRKYDVDAILLPAYAPLVRGPAANAGWCEAYRDSRQVLYLRTCP